MRIVVKEGPLAEGLLKELRNSGIKFEIRTKTGHEGFIGYAIEGTLEEIEKTIENLEGVDVSLLKEGFLSFKESVLHIIEHLKAGEDVERLLTEGSWVGDVLDQLHRAGALEYDGKTVRLREGVDVEGIKFEFKFPFNLVHDPEAVEKGAKQFVFVDLVREYEIEIMEWEVERINLFGNIASRYLPEETALRVYFALIGRSIIAKEILKALEGEKLSEDELIRGFTRALPLAIPTPRGTLVINMSQKALEDTLKALKKAGYIDIKGGKVRKLRDLP